MIAEITVSRARNRPICRRDFSTGPVSSSCRCSSLVRTETSGQRLMTSATRPASAPSVDRHHDGADLRQGQCRQRVAGAAHVLDQAGLGPTEIAPGIAGLTGGTFQADALPGNVELDRQGVPDREEGHAVARRRVHPLRQAHDRVGFLAQLDPVAQLQTDEAVDDHLVVVLGQGASRDEGQPGPLVHGPVQAEDAHAQGTVVVPTLDGRVDTLPRRLHARHRRDPIAEVRRHPRDLGERPARVALDHPQVGPDLFDQQRGVFHETSVDAAHAHDDHEQEADADRRQGEPAAVVSDVLEGEIHGGVTFRPSVKDRPLGSAGRSIRSPARNPATTSMASWPRRPSVKGRQRA